MKLDSTGLQETMKMFEKLESESSEMLEEAVYDGINVVADEMRAEIASLKTSEDYKKGEKIYPKREQIDSLLASMGYTPVKVQGAIINAKVGFDGYDGHPTKKYPRGHANQMIANSINKGTSFLVAQPFINRTKNKSQQNCIDAMQKSLDKSIQKAEK